MKAKSIKIIFVMCSLLILNNFAQENVPGLNNSNGMITKNSSADINMETNQFTWSAMQNGALGTVYSVAVNGTNVYAGGDFWYIGGLYIYGVARWNGTSWSAMGGDANSSVFVVAADGNGNVYAGGSFTSIAGVSANRIAKWNGSSWSALGSGANGNVWSLAVDGNGNVYAGGEFTTIGGVNANYIAKWNGSNWSVLGTGANYGVYSLAVDNSENVYAGGWFTVIGGVNANRIAKWNGSSWSAFGDGANSVVNAIAVDGSIVYAGGDFSTIGGLTTRSIAKWNGSSWSSVGSGVDISGAVRSIVVSGNDIYACGDFTSIGGVAVHLIAKWNGTSWEPIGTSGTNGVDGWNVYCMKKQPATGSMIVSGNFSNVYGISGGQNIARFTDSSNPLPVEFSSFSGKIHGSNIELSWKTITEINNYGFEIERSKINEDQTYTGWLKIGFVNGNGNSNSPKNYTYEDINISEGKYNYRLKQLDNNGTFNYSNTIEIDFTGLNKFELKQNFPNPFNPSTTVSFSLPDDSNVKLILYDALGQEIKVFLNEYKERGVHLVNLSLNEFNSGIYFYRIEAGSFVETKKMILLK